MASPPSIMVKKMYEPKASGGFKNKYLKAGFLILLAFLGAYFVFLQDSTRVTSKKVYSENQNHPFSHLKGYQQILYLQESFVRNAKSIKPSVVSINKLIKIDSPEFTDHSIAPSNSWLSKFKHWFSELGRSTYRMEGLGSGVVLDNHGHIITNHHVIENVEKLLIRFGDGREFTAKIVGTDPKTDLAVLKIFSLKSFPVPVFGQSDDLKVGEWVMAIGNPYGLDGTVTVGVISGKGRTDLGITLFENFLQTDASINPGNSGGPLINLQGKIVGINTAVAAIGAGVGFAIPIEMAVNITQQLIDTGSVERGWLGIGIQSLTPELAQSFKIGPGKTGVLVNNVDLETPANKGGIERGDIIIQYDGKSISSAKSLQYLVADTRVGKTVAIKVIRKGEEKTLKIKIGRMES